MRRVWRIFEDRINDYSLGKKFAALYIVCVIVPLLLTDGIILALISSREKNDEKIELENTCHAIKADLIIERQGCTPSRYRKNAGNN